MDTKAFFKYLSALLLFGLNGIVASHIALTSSEIVLLRTFIGSILLLALFLASKGKFHILTHRKDSALVGLSGIAMGISWIFLYEAYQQIGVSLASLLYYCGPVIVMMVSPFLFKEKLTASKILGFLIILAGIFCINGNAMNDSQNIWGIFCGAMSAILFFLMVTCNKLAKNITGMENSVIQLLVSFLTVAVFVGWKQGFAMQIPSGSWVWIFILGVVNTGIGCYLYFSPLSKLPVQTVAVCGYLEPLSAVVFASVLLHEQMTAVQILGAACIIGGAMIGELVKTDTLIHTMRRYRIVRI